MFLRFTLPEYSVSYLFLQSFKHFRKVWIFILSNNILLNFKPKTCFSWEIFSISTVIDFLVFIAFLTRFLRFPSALMWFSLIKISSLKLYLWLKPPPFLTAYFSRSLKFGVVFLVQHIFVFLFVLLTNVLVKVAIPEAWLKKLSKELLGRPDPVLFRKDQETFLFDKINEIRKSFTVKEDRKDYELMLTQLAEVKILTDQFFDNVVVNDENQDIKNNRLELLAMFCKVFKSFIDFSKLEGI